MTHTVKQIETAACRRHLLNWLQRALLGVGCTALSYAGFTLACAHLYQKRVDATLNAGVWRDGKIALTANHLAPKPSELLGRIEVPRLGIKVPLLEGTSWRTLRLGAGHIAGTAVPGGPGNTGIAGHRDTFFHRLQEIRKGDVVILQTTTGITRYEVDWIQIVSPQDSAILSVSNAPTLTLITCYPFRYIGAAPERYVVHARRK